MHTNTSIESRDGRGRVGSADGRDGGKNVDEHGTIVRQRGKCMCVYRQRDTDTGCALI